MCEVQPIVLHELHALYFCKPKFSNRQEKWAQRCVLGVLHNIIVFMICTMRLWILNNFIGFDMSFVACERTKKKWKRPCKKPLPFNHPIKTIIILLGKYNPPYCIPPNKNPLCLTTKDMWPTKTTIHHQMSNKTLNHKVTLWSTLLDIQQGTRNLGQLPKWVPLTYNKGLAKDYT
jgi:hypothetical protein